MQCSEVGSESEQGNVSKLVTLMSQALLSRQRVAGHQTAREEVERAWLSLIVSERHKVC